MNFVQPTFRLLAITFLTFAFLVMSASVDKQAPAYAQSATQDAGAGVSNSSSDAELWRQIRKGQPGTVSGGDKSGATMIQSGGQDWRMIRNGPLPFYSGLAILLTLVLLCLFFAVRGRIKVAGGMSGETITRFSLIERAGHWLLASSFIILALSGLNLIFGRSLLLPILGKDIFASITVFGKFVHNYVGFAFMIGLVMIVIMWIKDNFPSRTDIGWLLKGGGIIGNAHPPAKKFNAGQKMLFWLIVLCGISISISGWALLNPFTTTMFAGTFELVNSLFGTSYATELSAIEEQQYQSLWHAIMAVFMVVVILAHIYIGSVGMQGATVAMTSGEVDKNWAREHHSLWVEKQEAQAGTDSGSGALAGVVGATAAVGAAGVASVSGKDSSTDSSDQGAAEAVAEKQSLQSDRSAASKASSKPSKAADKKANISAAKKPATKSNASDAKKQAAKKKSADKASASSKPAKKASSAGKSAAASSTKKTKQASASKPAKKASVAGKSAAAVKSGKSAPSTKTSKASAAKKSSKSSAATKSGKSAAASGAKAKGAAKDDLKLISGVGPQYERKLHAMGMKRFEDVAKWSKKQQEEIGEELSFPGRIEREEWVKQAKALAKKAAKG